MATMIMLVTPLDRQITPGGHTSLRGILMISSTRLCYPNIFFDQDQSRSFKITQSVLGGFLLLLLRDLCISVLDGILQLLVYVRGDESVVLLK